MRCKGTIGGVPVTHSLRAGARSWNYHSIFLCTNFRNSVGQAGHRDTLCEEEGEAMTLVSFVSLFPALRGKKSIKNNLGMMGNKLTKLTEESTRGTNRC